MWVVSCLNCCCLLVVVVVAVVAVVAVVGVVVGGPGTFLYTRPLLLFERVTAQWLPEWASSWLTPCRRKPHCFPSTGCHSPSGRFPSVPALTPPCSSFVLSTKVPRSHFTTVFARLASAAPPLSVSITRTPPPPPRLLPSANLAAMLKSSTEVLVLFCHGGADYLILENRHGLECYNLHAEELRTLLVSATEVRTALRLLARSPASVVARQPCPRCPFSTLAFCGALFP